MWGYINYFLSWLPGGHPYDPEKENSLKTIAHNLLNGFNIFVNKNITIYNETEVLYDDDLFKITITAKLGLKAISKENIIANIDFMNSVVTNDNGFSQIVERIYKKLNDIKRNLEKYTYEKELLEFEQKIGQSIINGKLHIIADLNKEEIKLIFEIGDIFRNAEIYGYIELKIKFKRPILKFLKNCSFAISKINSIYENESTIFYALIGLTTIKILREGRPSLEGFLQWVDIIGNNKNFEQNVNSFFNHLQQFASNYNQFQQAY